MCVEEERDGERGEERESSIYIIILCLTGTTNQAHKCGSNCIQLAAKAKREKGSERAKERKIERGKRGEGKNRSRDSSNLTGDIHFTCCTQYRKTEQLDSWAKGERVREGESKRGSE